MRPGSAIRHTPDFWVTLNPIEEGGVRRLHALMLRHRWEVFFHHAAGGHCRGFGTAADAAVAGGTGVRHAERARARWLSRRGSERAGLTYHVDDSAQNCVDIVSDFACEAILIVPDNDATTIASARRLGIGTARVAQRLPRRARAGHVRPNTAGSTRKNLRPRRWSAK